MVPANKDAEDETKIMSDVKIIENHIDADLAAKEDKGAPVEQGFSLLPPDDESAEEMT